jgi:hypothetical protein
MGTGKNLADGSTAKISSMENRLSGTLKPVTARQEFVLGLGQRILAGNRAAFENHAANWHILAALIAGFVSLAVLLAMVVRALLIVSGKKRTALN